MIPHSSALAPDLAGGSTPITISAYSAGVAPGASRWRSISARVQSARLLHDFGEQFLPADRASLIARGDAFQKGVREVMGVVEGRSASNDRVLVLHELLDELDGTWRRGDHRLRLGT